MVNETCLPWIAASFLLWPAETSHRGESETSVSQLISCVLETRMPTGTDCQQVRHRSFIWLDDVEQQGAPPRAELSPILLTVYSLNMRTAYWMMSCCFFSNRCKFNLQAKRRVFGQGTRSHPQAECWVLNGRQLLRLMCFHSISLAEEVFQPQGAWERSRLSVSVSQLNRRQALQQ